MQRDQKRKPDAEYDERNEEVTVNENGAKFCELSHGGLCNWRNHKEAPGGLSTLPSHREPIKDAARTRRVESLADRA